MTNFYSCIRTAALTAVTILALSCSKDFSDPVINDNGYPEGYLVETTEEACYASIDELVRYIAESNLNDSFGISDLILKMYYSGEIASLAARNYIDVGINPDGSWKLQFERYNIKYRSTDAEGKPIVLSAAVIMPNNVPGSSRAYELDNITLYCDIYHDLNSDCPTIKGSPAMLRVLFNSMVVIPDFQGFGASYGERHPYLESDVLARQAIDSELAAFELARKLGISTCESYGTYNMGVSKGGLAALAVHKMLETSEPENVRDLIRLKSTFCSSSPCDVNALLESCISERSLANPWILAMAMNSVYYSHKDLFAGYRLSDLMSDEFNGYHIMIGSTEYSLMSLMESAKVYNSELTRIYRKQNLNGAKQILASRLLNGSSWNEEDELAKTVIDIYRQDDPSRGWNPQVPLTIEHSRNDDLIPINSAFSAYERLKYYDFGASDNNVTFKEMVLLDHKGSTADGIIKTLTYKNPAERK